MGACFSDFFSLVTEDVTKINGYENTGCAMSMMSNRLSFSFDFKGPSLTVDTACSSSLVALDAAFQAIKSGRCDMALVAGVNITLRPAVSLAFQVRGRSAGSCGWGSLCSSVWWVGLGSACKC